MKDDEARDFIEKVREGVEENYKGAMKIIDDEVAANYWENRERMCKSSQILLADMTGGEVEEEIAVKNEKDFVFKDLLEKLMEV